MCFLYKYSTVHTGNLLVVELLQNTVIYKALAKKLFFVTPYLYNSSNVSHSLMFL